MELLSRYTQRPYSGTIILFIPFRECFVEIPTYFFKKESLIFPVNYQPDKFKKNLNYVSKSKF